MCYLSNNSTELLTLLSCLLFPPPNMVQGWFHNVGYSLLHNNLHLYLANPCGTGGMLLLSTMTQLTYSLEKIYWVTVGEQEQAIFFIQSCFTLHRCPVLRASWTQLAFWKAVENSRLILTNPTLEVLHPKAVSENRTSGHCKMESGKNNESLLLLLFPTITWVTLPSWVILPSIE